MRQQRAARKGFPDGILVERIPAVTENQSPFIETARRQGNVRRDHDVVLRDMLHDPVIDGVELPFNNDEIYPIPGRYGDP